MINNFFVGRSLQDSNNRGSTRFVKLLPEFKIEDGMGMVS
jgi:hypothetical protein